MKKHKLKLTVFLAAAMTITLGGGYCENINLNNTRRIVYAEESMPSIQKVYLEQTGEIKAGNTIYFKISMDAKNKQFNGVYLQLKFDSRVFENIEVRPGEICTNSESTFVGKVRTEKERINIYFADTTGENEELINEDGSFAIIELKVKDDYSGQGSTDLILKSGFASDINETELDMEMQKKDTTIKDDKDNKDEDIDHKDEGQDKDNKDDDIDHKDEGQDKDDKDDDIDHKDEGQDKDDKDDKDDDTGNKDEGQDKDDTDHKDEGQDKDDKDDADHKDEGQDKDDKDDVEVINNIKIGIQENNQNISSMITPTFTITNNGTEEFNLSNLKFNYYYTKDTSAGIGQFFNCYYSGSINGNYKCFTSNIVGTLNSLNDSDKTDTADSCMEITFNGGILDAGQSMIMQTAVNKADWSSYDLNNDYSYNNPNNLSIYINDKKVSINKN